MPEISNGLLTRWDGSAEAVCIPEGVTTVGKGVFCRDTSLRSVLFASSVRTIGDFAFEGCRALECVALQSGIRRLGNGCFKDCVSLSRVELPETVASIHANAFENCAGLSEIRLPDGLRRNIEHRTFAQCVSLRHIVIPEGIQQIKQGAFCGCQALEEVVFGNPEVIIERTAFDGCDRLSPQTRRFIESRLPQDSTIDINSRASGAAGRLSNYTERRFFFDGVECGSIEGVLQSFKCPEPSAQRDICRLVGGWAKKAGGQYDWRQDQMLYWQGRAYPRRSEDYKKLLDRLYDAAFEQDAAFRADLDSLRGQKLDHHMGLTNPAETVLTRVEFVRQLQRLIDRLES